MNLLNAVELKVTIVQNIFDVLSIWYSNNSLTKLEKILVLSIFLGIENILNEMNFFYAIKYSLIFERYLGFDRKIMLPLNLINLSIEIKSTIHYILQEYNEFIRLTAITFFCLIVQLLFHICLSKHLEKTKLVINAKRKIFHIFAFFAFYTETNLVFVLSQWILLFFSITASSATLKRYLTTFLSERDQGETVLSHVYLLGACYYMKYFIRGEDYVSSLIAICFLDSAASIFGIMFKSKGKSYIGTFSGIVTGIIVYYYFYHRTNLCYFIFIGLIERSFKINDNITIPYFSVIYFKILSFLSTRYNGTEISALVNFIKRI